MAEEKQLVKIAVLDLYDGFPNQGMRCFSEIVRRYAAENELEIQYEVFEVRKNAVVPDTSFDVYISSGGPGSPLDSEGSEWEARYFDLVDQLEAHNNSDAQDKKYVFFVCHSFQLMCRRLKLGVVSLRKSPSFGALPVHKAVAGFDEPCFQGLAEPFYAVDSRSWQVTIPDAKRFAETGAILLAIEKDRPHIPLERCMMAIRFNDYFIGTQFHPEADAVGMTSHLLTKERKEEVIAEHGLAKYEEMLERLNDPDKIMLTQRTIIPHFLDQAIRTLQNA